MSNVRVSIPNPELSERQCRKLYKAAVKGDWRLADKIIRENGSIINASIMRGNYTAVQVAAGAKHVDFVKNLLALPAEVDLSKKTNNGNNAFCIAASVGSVEIAEAMLSRNPDLLTEPGHQGRFPIFFAALFGHEEMVKHLYQVHRRRLNYMMPRQVMSAEDEKYLFEVFFSTIESGLFGVASTILEDYSFLARKSNSEGKTALHLLAQKHSAFTVGTPSGSRAGILLDKLLVILENDDTLSTGQLRELIGRPQHVLFDAVNSGNSELEVKVINVFPSLIWETNKKNWSIIHAAVSHRDATIFNLVHEIGFFKDVIVDFKDSTNNDTLLHLAARLAPANELNKLPGAAFQMQRELLWFEEVKNTIQAAFIYVRNGVDVEAIGAQVNIIQAAVTDVRNGLEQVDVVAIGAQMNIIEAAVTDVRNGLEQVDLEAIGAQMNIIEAAVTDVRNGFEQVEVEAIRAQMNIIQVAVTDVRNGPEQVDVEAIGAQVNIIQGAVTNVRNGLEQVVEAIGAQVNIIQAAVTDVRNGLERAKVNKVTQERKTAEELFTSEHQLLMKEGRKWMNGTAQSCTIVSTLIAGALFAAGITVTLGGGTSKDKLKTSVYRIFIISDAMAVMFALAAILTFLAILTSRYAERDFLKSLPFKLIMGLGLLFLSIIAMMVAFSTAFIIAYDVKDVFALVVIGCAVLAVLLFVYMQLPLLKDIIDSTFASRYLFRYSERSKLKILLSTIYSTCL